MRVLTMGRLTCFRIEDEDGKFNKTYRHMGHIKQALHYLRLSWRYRSGVERFDVVEYKLVETKRTPIQDVS